MFKLDNDKLAFIEKMMNFNIESRYPDYKMSIYKILTVKEREVNYEDINISINCSWSLVSFAGLYSA
ncbi:hypothetical protein GMMP15_580034 [Candidatus Magnetomoraceae bacterium gMMP-15]